jgi:hypothetical protein
MVAVQNPTRVWPKPIVHIVESTSKGREGDVYRVLAWHGVYECDCPARVECKHIKAQREADLADLAWLKEIRAMNTIEERGLVPMSDQAVETYRAPKLGTALVTADQMQTMKDIASTVMKAGAGMVPDTIKTPEAALAVLLAGHEMGVPPFRALDLIYPVNGHMKMMTELMVALVEQRDPTARFVYHHIGFDGADIELFRKGISKIRITYTDEERKRARLGMIKAGGGGEQWLPVRNADGSPKKHPQTNPNGSPHPKAGKTIYERNPDYDPRKTEWVEDPDSNWYMYPAEHFTWMALKRCIRFGASDLVNLTPMEMHYFEEDEIDLPASSKAVFANGRMTKDLAEPDEGANDGPPDDEEPPDFDDAPPVDEEPQQAAASASAAVELSPPPSTPAAASPDRDPGVTDVPMDLATTRQTIETLLIDCKDTWGPQDFAALQVEMGQFTPDGKGIFNPKSVPESKAAEALAFLRSKRGDA